MDGRHVVVRTVKVTIHYASNLPQAIRTFDKLDAYVVINVWRKDHGTWHKIGSSTKSTPRFNTSNPVWDETVEIQVPMMDNISVHITIKDYDELMRGLGEGKAFAAIESLSSDKVWSYAEGDRTMELPLRYDKETTSHSKKSVLKVSFSHPRLEEELAAVRAKWDSGDTTNSGLDSLDYQDVFLDAASELDGLMYFFDILFSQFLELTTLLGDLGMVICGKFIRPLLDEIDQRTVESDRLIFTNLHDSVYEHRILDDLTKHRHSWFRRLFEGSHDAADQQKAKLVEDNAHKMHMLKETMMGTLAELRRALTTLTAAGIQEEARGKMTEIVKRLGAGSTAARSDRFQQALSEFGPLNMLEDNGSGSNSPTNRRKPTWNFSAQEPPSIGYDLACEKKPSDLFLTTGARTSEDLAFGSWSMNSVSGTFSESMQVKLFEAQAPQAPETESESESEASSSDLEIAMKQKKACCI